MLFEEIASRKCSEDWINSFFLKRGACRLVDSRDNNNDWRYLPNKTDANLYFSQIN